MNLQLFAAAFPAPEGAAGAAAPAAAGAAAPAQAAPQTPVQTPATGAAPATPGQAPAQTATEQPGAQQTPPQQGGAWDANKDAAFARRLEAERAKIRQEEANTARQQYAWAEKAAGLFQQAGLQPDQVLQTWEQEIAQQQAQQMGVSPQVYQVMQQQQQQLTALQSRIQQQTTEQQLVDLQTRYPDASGHAPQIAKLISNGLTAEQAYWAAAGPTKVQSATEQARLQAEQQTLASQQLAQSRRVEDSGPAGNAQHLSYANMPEQDFEGLVRAAKSGRLTRQG